MNQKLKRIRTKDIDKILCLIHYVDLENELRSRFTFQLFAGNCVDDMNMQALWVLLMCFLEAYMYKLLYIVQRATESLQYNSESTKRTRAMQKLISEATTDSSHHGNTNSNLCVSNSSLLKKTR